MNVELWRLRPLPRGFTGDRLLLAKLVRNDEGCLGDDGGKLAGPWLQLRPLSRRRLGLEGQHLVLRRHPDRLVALHRHGAQQLVALLVVTVRRLLPVQCLVAVFLPLLLSVRLDRAENHA